MLVLAVLASLATARQHICNLAGLRGICDNVSVCAQSLRLRAPVRDLPLSKTCTLDMHPHASAFSGVCVLVVIGGGLVCASLAADGCEEEPSASSQAPSGALRGQSLPGLAGRRTWLPEGLG